MAGPSTSCRRVTLRSFKTATRKTPGTFFERIVENFKKRERKVGIELVREEGRREWLAWCERQQAAQRDGRPFTEPPPGYRPDESGHDREGSR